MYSGGSNAICVGYSIFGVQQADAKITPRSPNQSQGLHLSVFQDKSERGAFFFVFVGQPHGDSKERNPGDLNSRASCQVLERWYLYPQGAGPTAGDLVPGSRREQKKTHYQQLHKSYFNNFLYNTEFVPKHQLTLLIPNQF